MRRMLGKLSDKYALLRILRRSIKEFFPHAFYFRSYSQWGEDSLISQFLTDRQGFYVDVGAGHPIQGNNTFFLYRRGYRGLLIDPIGKNTQLSRVFRPRDVAVNSLVGSSASSKTFYEFENYGISTTSETRARDLQTSGYVLRKRHSLQSRPLSEILEANHVPLTFDLLSIDVEGDELNVLESLDFKKHRPEVICVEELTCLPAQETKIRKLLELYGYRLIISAWNSHIFLSK